MASSVVYAGIIGSILASLPSVRTTFVLFDTSIADLSEQLSDPVSILFSSQLGGGTDIAQAIKYGAQQVSNPQDTLLFCISDLEEGGSEEEMFRQFYLLKERGVKVYCVLGIEDGGRLHYDRENAKKLSSINIPCFAATPNELTGILASELNS